MILNLLPHVVMYEQYVFLVKNKMIQIDYMEKPEAMDTKTLFTVFNGG